jgi:hypothetical protein
MGPTGNMTDDFVLTMEMEEDEDWTVSMQVHRVPVSANLICRVLF